MAEQFYERYERIAVDEPLRYGDVIIFVAPLTAGDAAHSVVYIATTSFLLKTGRVFFHLGFSLATASFL